MWRWFKQATIAVGMVLSRFITNDTRQLTPVEQVEPQPLEDEWEKLMFHYTQGNEKQMAAATAILEGDSELAKRMRDEAFLQPFRNTAEIRPYRPMGKRPGWGKSDMQKLINEQEKGDDSLDSKE